MPTCGVRGGPDAVAAGAPPTPEAFYSLLPPPLGGGLYLRLAKLRDLLHRPARSDACGVGRPGAPSATRASSPGSGDPRAETY